MVEEGGVRAPRSTRFSFGRWTRVPMHFYKLHDTWTSFSRGFGLGFGGYRPAAPPPPTRGIGNSTPNSATTYLCTVAWWPDKFLSRTSFRRVLLVAWIYPWTICQVRRGVKLGIISLRKKSLACTWRDKIWFQGNSPIKIGAIHTIITYFLPFSFECTSKCFFIVI